MSGIIDPITGLITLTVSITPPAGDPNFSGAHLYAEIPDQSGSAPFIAGSAVAGSTAGGTGNYIDLGFQTYTAGTEPWNITIPAPPGIDPTVDTPSRLYVSSTSSSVDNVLHRATDPTPTPNQTFTLVSLASGTPSAATNVTGLSGDITASTMPDDNSTGKLVTPVLVMVGSIPTAPGWTGRLLITWGNTDATLATNQSIVGPLITAAGPVYGSPDGIPVPHSFALDTPKTLTRLTVWLQSGLMDATGVMQWNNIVPGITPSSPLAIGTTTGTIDAAAAMAASIASSMAVISGLFGVAPSGITNPLLGPSAVATINVQNLAVSNPLLAALCVQATNLAGSSVTAAALANLAVGTAAMQTACVTNAIIANACRYRPTGPVGNAYGRKYRTGNHCGCQHRFMQRVQAACRYRNVHRGCNLAAFCRGAAGQPDCIGSHIAEYRGVPDNQFGNGHVQRGRVFPVPECQLDYVVIQRWTHPYAFWSTMTMASGGNQLQVTASQIQLTGGGAALTMTSSTITLKPTGGTAGVAIGSTGVATFTNSSGVSTSIDGNSVGTGYVVAVQVSANQHLIAPSGLLQIGAGASVTVSGNAAFTGTLAAAIAAGKNVMAGIIY